MKGVLLCCLLAFVSAAPKSGSPHNLQNHLDDFVKLIPLDDIKAIVLNYLNNDEEVQDIFEHVQSEKFMAAIERIKKDEVIVELEKFFDGIILSEEVLKFTPESVKERPLKGKGLKGLLQEVNSTLPHEKLRSLFQDKLQNSPEFKAFHDKISSDEVKKFIQRALHVPELRELFVKIQKYGVNVNEVLDVGKELLGWTSDSSISV